MIFSACLRYLSDDLAQVSPLALSMLFANTTLNHPLVHMSKLEVTVDRTIAGSHLGGHFRTHSPILLRFRALAKEVVDLIRTTQNSYHPP